MQRPVSLLHQIPFTALLCRAFSPLSSICVVAPELAPVLCLEPAGREEQLAAEEPSPQGRWHSSGGMLQN